MEVLEITELDGDEGLRLTGELDVSTAPQLNEAIAGIGGNGQVTLDLSELSFIDSSGLHAIVAYARTANGNGPLVLDGVSSAMLRIFEMTDLAQHPDLEIRSGNGG
jgi:anti-anti-sigma factor